MTTATQTATDKSEHAEPETTHPIKAVTIRQDGLLITFQENGCIIVDCGNCGEESHIYPDEGACNDIADIMGWSE